MAHGPPQPPDAVYSYGDFDFGPLPDMTGGHHASDPNPAASHLATDGNPFMFDSSMLETFTGMPMTLGTTSGGSMNPPFGPLDDPADPAVAQSENQFNTASNNIPGAGPLPLGSFGQGGMGGGNSNTLTEFTKRRNWPAKVVEELKDLLQILDSNGRLKYASPNAEQLTGYTPEELQDQFLKDLVHPDDQGLFVAELNESIASGSPLRMFYRFKKKDGSYAIFETIGHAHIAAAKFAPNPNNQSPFCQAVFMMARPYPTKNAGLLDSFLEHKIENERLKRRIAELRREEEADNDEANRQWLQSRGSQSDTGQTEVSGMSGTTPIAGSVVGGSGAMSERSGLNGALTRENLEGVSGGVRPDSLKDKMARYEGAYTDTIEMLTGLRYVEGERSKGITTGNASPTLIKGDAGIAIPVDRDPRTGEKKKKLKTSEEYVCTDCGTLDSPEWRKGPNGPKTLCNACGLRWAKKEKKKHSTHHHPPPIQANMSGPIA
ncbi:Cutinase gene palindrome-binding protein-like protein [Hapsidospora chrysogenum ATCC 11550]|uniref:Cutinase gene palindrome-binding protein-like protein n=1 Tax=Hapsidospora chrysogenum (strain ATCC 11550 / CBS 779.69 / DSM 880 / IAM 14645 / JCM 23072 / IMI 49137) TaxID=857340 RepID=A0A086SXI9_HAPC1|nr:Cutinase gene palindrome-binding protein-like protein [Hapsidospora chrysogenum ATCC 11550]